MTLTDDEIADRVVKAIQSTYGADVGATWMRIKMPGFMDDAEAYRLAFVADVRERAKVRRQAKRVRAKVFAALGVADRKIVEK